MITPFVANIFNRMDFNTILEIDENCYKSDTTTAVFKVKNTFIVALTSEYIIPGTHTKLIYDIIFF